MRKKWSTNITDILEFKADDRKFFNKKRQKAKDKIFEDLQVNILKSMKRKYSLYCFLTFYDGDERKKKIVDWLRNLEITSLKDQQENINKKNSKREDNSEKEKKCEIELGLYFTYQGYVYFYGSEEKVDEELLVNRDDDMHAFKQGLVERNKSSFFEVKKKLNNEEENDCKEELGNDFRDPQYKNPVHAMILINCNDQKLFEHNRIEDENEKNKRLLEMFRECTNLKNGLFSITKKSKQKLKGATPKEEELGEVFFEIGFRDAADVNNDSSEKGKEWFGFVDAISNPRFFPKLSRISRSWLGRIYFNILNAIQKLIVFVFSARRQDRIYRPHKTERASNLNTVLRNDILSTKGYGCSSFAVFLKLEQDVKAFHDIVNDLQKGLSVKEKEISKKEVKAFIIGRYQDGTPLIKPPWWALGLFSKNKKPSNQFNYYKDLDGRGCPFNAHIRKANTRDRNEERRIVRRGRVYGYNFENKSSNKGYIGAEKTDSVDPNSHIKNKGLLFMSFQSRLQNFEYIIQNGLYAYNHDNRNIGQDLLFADQDQYHVTARYKNAKGKMVTPYLIIKKKPVKFKGGYYFLAPSISFIKDRLKYI